MDGARARAMEAGAITPEVAGFRIDTPRTVSRRGRLGIAGTVAFVAAALTPGAVSADLDDYLNNPGRQQATEVGAQCGSGAGSGAFGYFGGKDNNLSGGANGYQTGLNNSAVCGNRQGNL